MGSRIHRTGPAALSPESPYSSPRTPSAGRSAASAATTCRSTALSAAVTTSVSVLLVSTSVIASVRIRRAVTAASRAIRTAIPSNVSGVDVLDSTVMENRPFSRHDCPGQRLQQLRRPPPEPARRAGGVLRREDLARRRYNSPLPTLHGLPPAGPSAFRGLPHTPASL